MSVGSFRGWVAIVAAIGVLAVGCTTSRKTNTSTGNTGGTKAGGATNSFPTTATGVTADTIKLGFSYVDLKKLAEAGVVKVDHGDYEKVIKVLVDDINARGGINGRKIQAFTAKYFPTGDEEQLAACTKLTEDDKVFAVLGGLLFDQNLCIAQQHSTVLISGFAGFNQVLHAKARAPWATGTASDERGIRALVKLLDQNGKLKSATIGVYSQVPTNKAIVDLMVKEIEGAGYKVADKAIASVPATDTQAFNAQEKVIAERFQNKHIDTVFVDGAPPGSNFDAVGYHPALYSPSTGNITAAAFTNPLGKFPIVAGTAVSADPDAGYNTPEMRRCRQVWQKATGKAVKTVAQENADQKSSGNTAVATMCTALQIFVAAATKAGKSLNQNTFQQGLESIGNISLPVAPVASFGPSKSDGQDSFQLMRQDPKWKSGDTTPEFLPVGKPITLP